MEGLKKRREALRRQFSKLEQEVEDTISAQNPDREAIKVAYRIFVEGYATLTTLDDRIFDAMITESTTKDEDAEMASVLIFKKRAEALRMKVETLTQAATEDAMSTVLPAEIQPRIRMPEIEFKKFGGNLTDWLGFWARFEKIDKSRWEGGDKYWFLMQALLSGSEPHRIVERFPQTDSGYVEAIETLKRRYGDEVMLLHVYVRELYRILMEHVKSKDKRPFVELFNEIDSHFRVLKALKLEKSDPATLLFLLVESCLPEEILNSWQRSPMSTLDGTKEIPPRNKLDILLDYMENEVKIQQRVNLAKSFNETPTLSKSKEGKDRKPQGGKVKLFQRRDTGEANFHTGDYSNCFFCGKNNHHPRGCFVAKQKSYQEVMDILKKNGACFKCFDKHLAKDCQAQVNCRNCGGAHNDLTCSSKKLIRNWKRKNSYRPNPNFEGGAKKPRQDEHHETPQAGMANLLCSNEVLLQTLKVKVGKGQSQRTVRAFLDSGSQRSYILRRTALEMKLQKKAEEVIVHSLFGGQKTQRIVHGKYDLHIRPLHDDIEFVVEVRDQLQICDNLPRVTRRNHQIMTELNELGIQLSDVGGDESPVELLLGADLYGRLLTGDVKQLQCGPSAVKTFLGWTLMGRNPEARNEESSALSLIAVAVTDTNLAKLWELEAIGINDPIEITPTTQIQEEVKKDLISHATRDKCGRYSVKLPKREGISLMPTNKEVAIKRLESTTKKLKSTNLFHEYGKLFRDWEHEGFIEEVAQTTSRRQVHYLPHRAVIKPSSLTTPVRPVFDASCRTKGYPSLNDCLHTGTNHILLIPDVLLRFREKSIAFTSDIRKAFQMIEIDSSDRDFLRFLWWKNQDCQQLVEYRHARVPFGATSSPFILGAVLEHHLLTQQEPLQPIAEKLLKFLYVDNCCGSVDTLAEYHIFKENATNMLADAFMDLRMWKSNAEELSEEDTMVESVLGMKWQRDTDTLRIDVSKISIPRRITKRTVLSTVQQVFDPIGFTCPATLPIKLILQRAWIGKLKWDDDLPKEEETIFRDWFAQLNLFEEIQIPRLITGGCTCRKDWTLNVFTDSSKTAYGAVVYLRVVNNGTVHVQLLAAKSRLAPLKEASIPRLELLGCLIGARLASQVIKALDLQDVRCVYLTDSSTARAWILQNENWGTFIGNRTAEINRLTNKNDWYYISGSLNAADLPSRGCSIKTLLESQWWNGPQWLYSNEEDWPRVHEELDVEAIEKERKKEIIMTSPSVILNVRKQRTFAQLGRITAWTLRFVYNCGIKAGHGNKLLNGAEYVLEPRTEVLSDKEKQWGESGVIRTIQKEAFDEDRQNCLRGLKLKLGPDGILRVETRLTYREDTESFKFPAILPGKHPIVVQLITDEHRQYAHAGAGFLVSHLREKYWILHTRQSVKRVINKCYRCRRYSAKATITEMPGLIDSAELGTLSHTKLQAWT